MLLINPRRLARSRNTSCRTPFSTTAARASCVLALTRMSVLIALPTRHTGCLEQRRGFEQRQSHHAGITAFQVRDEDGGVSLDGVSARLVGRLSGFPVAARFAG